MTRKPLQRIGLCVLAVAAFAGLACVHHPRRVELQLSSRREALDVCDQALRRRFANVFWNDSERGLLSTDARFSGPDALTRSRAFIALSPGQFGWIAEVTVVEEKLVDRDFAGIPALPRWEYLRRDRVLEDYIASECERTAKTSQPFVDADSTASSRASSRPAPAVANPGDARASR